MSKEDKNNINAFMQKTYVVVIGALICCALWGSAFPCIKLGYKYSNISSNETNLQIFYAGIRFTLAGFFTIILGSIIKKSFLKPNKESCLRIVKLSFFQTILQYILFYIGLAHASGVKASIIEGTNVFVAIIVAGVVFKLEKVTKRKLIGCLIGFFGVVLVNVNGSSIGSLLHGFSFMGEGFVFLSTFAYAVSSVLLKRYSKSDNPVMLSGYQFLFGGIVMSTIGVILGAYKIELNTKSILMIIWLALVSAVAYSLWGILLKYNKVSRVAVFGFMNPVFGVILSALLLKEINQLGIMCFVSLILVCLGIFIAQGAQEKVCK